MSLYDLTRTAKMSDGHWSIDPPNDIHGGFYAKVARREHERASGTKLICESDMSATRRGVMVRLRTQQLWSQLRHVRAQRGKPGAADLDVAVRALAERVHHLAGVLPEAPEQDAGAGTGDGCPNRADVVGLSQQLNGSRVDPGSTLLMQAVGKAAGDQGEVGSL